MTLGLRRESCAQWLALDHGEQHDDFPAAFVQPGGKEKGKRKEMCARRGKNRRQGMNATCRPRDIGGG